jgi:hypothetical protein
MPNKDPNAELEPPNRRPALCLNLRQVEQFGQGIPPRRGRVRFPERPEDVAQEIVRGILVVHGTILADFATARSTSWTLFPRLHDPFCGVHDDALVESWVKRRLGSA